MRFQEVSLHPRMPISSPVKILREEKTGFFKVSVGPPVANLFFSAVIHPTQSFRTERKLNQYAFLPWA